MFFFIKFYDLVLNLLIIRTNHALANDEGRSPNLKNIRLNLKLILSFEINNKIIIHLQ